jgi:hypothetical protein
MTKYYFHLRSDYTGTEALRTYRIEFQEQIVVDEQYQGDIDAVPYEAIGRAGRAFILTGLWTDPQTKKESKIHILHLFWQIKNFKDYDVIFNKGTKATVKAEVWVIDALKTDMGIKRFSVSYKAVPYQTKFNE